jgi:hypothetical protein
MSFDLPAFLCRYIRRSLVFKPRAYREQTNAIVSDIFYGSDKMLTSLGVVQ